MHSHFLLLSLLLPTVLSHSSPPPGHVSTLSARDWSTSVLRTTLSGPSTVSSLDDAILTATVTNTGPVDAWVYTSGSVLDETPTESFSVTKKGRKAAFRGVQPMLSRKLPEEAFVLLKAGQTLSYKHKVAALYDFSALGSGAFTFTPRVAPHAFFGSKPPSFLADILSVFDASARSNPFAPSSGLPSTTVTVTHDVSKRSLDDPSALPSLAKRAVVTCADTKRAAYLTTSFAEAQSLAKLSISYLKAQPFGTVTRKYFGFGGASRPTTVMNQVATEKTTTRTLSCTDDYGACSGGVIAYTLIATTNMYYCNIFFSEKPTQALCNGTTVEDRDIRGATVLHELTHALAKTEDYGYGVSFNTFLASTLGFLASNNADNYNCFATEVYATTQCKK